MAGLQGGRALAAPLQACGSVSERICRQGTTRLPLREFGSRGRCRVSARQADCALGAKSPSK